MNEGDSLLWDSTGPSIRGVCAPDYCECGSGLKREGMGIRAIHAGFEMHILLTCLSRGPCHGSKGRSESVTSSLA
jgi:hypothetical protein